MSSVKVAMLQALLIGSSLLVVEVSGLDNGLALMPPMGWNSWRRFMCNECALDSRENCLTSELMLQMADKMVEDGYLAAGYEYLILDSCWANPERDAEGRLYADPQRFPEGMKKLIDEVHKKGLKFGIAVDLGTTSRYPGSRDHYAADAHTFAEWGVDYVKALGNYDERLEMGSAYLEMGQALRGSGRHMVYCCGWPLSHDAFKTTPDYDTISKNCNLWKNSQGISYSWDRIYGIVDYEASVQDVLVNVTGPGAWTDPDLLVIGNFGLTVEQQRAHMSFWAMMAAPLIMSNDLRNIPLESKELLQNKYIIAVDQDPLGLMGRRINKTDALDVWARWVTPQLSNGKKSLAVLVHNTKTSGGPTEASISLLSLGLDSAKGYLVTDLVHNNAVVGKFYPSENIHAVVAPLDIFFFKATIL